MIKVLFLILFAETWNTLGQVLFKKATNRLDRPHLRDLRSYLDFVRAILGMPAIWFGLGSMVLGLVVWLIALAQTDLSIAFPIGSLQYLLILIAARLFLGERIDGMKLVGNLLVVTGIIFIAASGR